MRKDLKGAQDGVYVRIRLFWKVWEREALPWRLECTLSPGQEPWNTTSSMPRFPINLMKVFITQVIQSSIENIRVWKFLTAETVLRFEFELSVSERYIIIVIVSLASFYGGLRDRGVTRRGSSDFNLHLVHFVFTSGCTFSPPPTSDTRKAQDATNKSTQRQSRIPQNALVSKVVCQK